jgi:phosphoribosylaminoimidazole (AIR) synthetase
LKELPREAIHGMVHCSGGGQTKILHFLGEGLHVIKDDLFDWPPLFRLIAEQSGTPAREMYKVFNMGHRMELYVPRAVAADIIAISQSFDIDARIVGRVEAGESGASAQGGGSSAQGGGSSTQGGAQVTIRTDNEEFTYTK